MQSCCHRPYQVVQSSAGPIQLKPFSTGSDSTSPVPSFIINPNQFVQSSSTSYQTKHIAPPFCRSHCLLPFSTLCPITIVRTGAIAETAKRFASGPHIRSQLKTTNYEKRFEMDIWTIVCSDCTGAIGISFSCKSLDASWIMGNDDERDRKSVV